MLRFIAISIIAAFASAVMAQGQEREHDHGVNGLPDWYDPGCCHQLDCKPVKDGDIAFEMFEGLPTAVYTPTGNRFYRNQFKLSQDERYHVCIHAISGYSLCFYDRPGAALAPFDRIEPVATVAP